MGPDLLSNLGLLTKGVDENRPLYFVKKGKSNAEEALLPVCRSGRLPEGQT